MLTKLILLANFILLSVAGVTAVYRSLSYRRSFYRSSYRTAYSNYRRSSSSLYSSYVSYYPGVRYSQPYYSGYYSYYYSLYYQRSYLYSNYRGSGEGAGFCVNYVANDNGTTMGIFTCPLPFEPATFTACCGEDYAQYCCEYKSSSWWIGLVIPVILIVLIVSAVTLYCYIRYLSKRRHRKQERLAPGTGTVVHRQVGPIARRPAPPYRRNEARNEFRQRGNVIQPNHNAQYPLNSEMYWNVHSPRRFTNFNPPPYSAHTPNGIQHTYPPPPSSSSNLAPGAVGMTPRQTTDLSVKKTDPVYDIPPPDSPPATDIYRTPPPAFSPREEASAPQPPGVIISVPSYESPRNQPPPRYSAPALEMTPVDGVGVGRDVLGNRTAVINTRNMAPGATGAHLVAANVRSITVKSSV